MLVVDEGLQYHGMQGSLPNPVANSQQQQPQQSQMSREMVVSALKKHMMQLDCSQEEYADKFQSVSMHACMSCLWKWRTHSKDSIPCIWISL